MLQIEFPSPNEAARHDILKIHSRKMNLTRKINLKKIADQMTGRHSQDAQPETPHTKTDV
eukprot:1160911-Pelagomonas_calceolata.AAC.21